MKPLTKVEQALNKYIKAKKLLFLGDRNRAFFEFFSTVLNQPRNYKHLLYKDFDKNDYKKYYRIKNSEKYDCFFEEEY